MLDGPEDGCGDARAVYAPDGTRQTNDVCAASHAFWIEMPAAKLERQIEAKRREIADIEEKRDYFLRNFQAYWAPVEAPVVPAV